MGKNNQYSTLVLALSDLSKKGFIGNFSVSQDGMLDDGNGNSYSHNDVELIEFHRFEGETNPADSSILYAVQTSDGTMGTVVDAYGARGSEKISEFMNRVKQNQFK